MSPDTRPDPIGDRLARLLGGTLPAPLGGPVRATSRWGARAARRLAGRLEGLAYQLGGQQPDPDVDDVVLVQRVRSHLGPLEKQLDVPRVHVSVVDHVVELHGVVGTDAEARQLERSTERVSGVRGVRSRLHIGLGPGDTRPSEGRASAPPSPARRELVGAARATGLSDDDAERVARAVVDTVLECLPDGERAHVVAHLPEDVRAMARAPLEVGQLAKPRRVDEFDQLVAEGAQVPVHDAAMATRNVLEALRRLVPEEVADVEAVLPSELKPLWAAPAAVAPTT